MSRLNRTVFVLLFVLALSSFISSRAEAEIHPGIRTGGYFDAGGAFLGGEILTDLPWRNWYFNPNVEFAFGDDADIVAFNFDVHYDLETRSKLYLWVGGGPAIILVNPDDRFRNQDNETDFGLNLFMGVGFRTGGNFIPYIQPKVVLSDNSEFALAFGVRF